MENLLVLQKAVGKACQVMEEVCGGQGSRKHSTWLLDCSLALNLATGITMYIVQQLQHGLLCLFKYGE